MTLKKREVKVSNVCMLIFIYLFYLFGVLRRFQQVISRRVVGRAEKTSTYSSLGLCTVNCRPTASNYQLSHLRPSRGSNPGLRGESVTTLPPWPLHAYRDIYMCYVYQRMIFVGVVVF